jgi:1,4-dihydroxy-2-naphthoyl-CoA hydrolase
LAEAGFAQAVPLVALLGIEIVSAEQEEVRGTLPWRADLCTSGGILHGGALMALADTLGGVCAFLHLSEGAGTATVESKTNFFRPVSAGTVTGVARPLHVGRSFIVVQTDLTDEGDRRVAQVTQTQAVTTRRAE